MEETAARPSRSVTEPGGPEPAPDPTGDEPPGVASPRRSWMIGMIVLVVAAILLASLTAFNYGRIGQADSVRLREQTILQIARQGVLNVTSLSHQNIDATLKNLVDGSTGEFRKQFEGRSSTFKDMVAQSAVVSEGTITEAGIESSDDHSGKAIVAVRAKVSNKAAPQGEQRQYRMAVNVVREGDRWLVSGLEFVP